MRTSHKSLEKQNNKFAGKLAHWVFKTAQKAQWKAEEEEEGWVEKKEEKAEQQDKGKQEEEDEEEEEEEDLLRGKEQQL
jgi:hypothetical protein